MRWIFSAAAVLAVGGMVSWAAGADCCGMGCMGMHGTGMYGDGLSAVAAQPCGAPIYGYPMSFCPETPRCVCVWDEYCQPKSRRGCRPCGLPWGQCGTTRGGCRVDIKAVEQTRSVPAAPSQATAAPVGPDRDKFSAQRVRRLPKVTATESASSVPGC